jgi:hypothetical protein
VAPDPLYIPPSRDGDNSEQITRTADPVYFPTTSAENYLFFQLTPANAGSSSNFLGQEFNLNTCLMAISSQRCNNSNCTGALTANSVPQKIYSWDPQSQLWWERGPGATGPSSGPGFPGSYAPILANGVKGADHFSPDTVQDYIVLAPFRSDVINASNITSPTSQCGSIWRYTGSSWSSYQSCEWYGNGTRSVNAFTLNKEQYLAYTSMVSQQYENGSLIKEQFRGLPNFVLKWSSRRTDNRGAARPYGFFLSGGEALAPGQQLQSGEPGYNASVGNNGTNVFQVGEEGVENVSALKVKSIAT